MAGSELVRLQRWFWDLVTAPRSVGATLPTYGTREPEAVPLTGWIAAADEEAATERLDVYADMYFFRLLGCLREDYPKLVTLVGDDAFHDLVTDYLIAHPSRHPSVRHVGRHLASFVRTHALASEWPHAAALAELEWARIEAFDDREIPRLEASMLASLPPEAWGSLRLQTIPALRLLALDADVAPLWRAIERGEALPEAPAGEAFVLVWRQDDAVYHRALERGEHAALSLVVGGIAFEALCERLANDRPVEAAAQAILPILATWVADGLLAAPPELSSSAA